MAGDSHAWIEAAGQWIEAAGVLIVVAGAVVATARFLAALVARSPIAYERYRKDLGRSILLGLEFLIIGDIIGTVVLEPSLTNVAVLGGIVLVRTFLSFSLEMEISGRWPWQRADTEKGQQERPS